MLGTEGWEVGWIGQVHRCVLIFSIRSSSPLERLSQSLSRTKDIRLLNENSRSKNCYAQFLYDSCQQHWCDCYKVCRYCATLNSTGLRSIVPNIGGSQQYKDMDLYDFRANAMERIDQLSKGKAIE